MFNQSALPLCHSRLTSFSLSNHCTENTCEFRRNCAFYKPTNKDEDTLTFTDNKTKLSVMENMVSKFNENKNMKKDFKEFQVGDKVEISWIDSCSYNTQWTLSEDMNKSDTEPTIISSVGIILYNETDYITITQNWGFNPVQYSGLTTIPKGCIKDVFLLIRKI